MAGYATYCNRPVRISRVSKAKNTSLHRKKVSEFINTHDIIVTFDENTGERTVETRLKKNDTVE